MSLGVLQPGNAVYMRMLFFPRHQTLANVKVLHPAKKMFRFFAAAIQGANAQRASMHSSPALVWRGIGCCAYRSTYDVDHPEIPRA